tara:strand:- start:241 stop:369 length:129 start_codon:yes stop_codon:yes gene_type:complete
MAIYGRFDPVFLEVIIGIKTMLEKIVIPIDLEIGEEIKKDSK